MEEKYFENFYQREIMYKLYTNFTCFDTKSVKITHFHLFIKEIILLFTSV